METRAARISGACELLDLQSGGGDQLEHLEHNVSESARMVTEAVASIMDRELSGRELQLVSQYLDLSRRLADVIRARRSSIQQEYRQLATSVKIKNTYSCGQDSRNSTRQK